MPTASRRLYDLIVVVSFAGVLAVTMAGTCLAQQAVSEATTEEHSARNALQQMPGVPSARAKPVVTAHAYHFSGSPWRGGSTSAIRRLKTEAERRVEATGNQLVFDIDGHYSVVGEYTEKIAADQRNGELGFLCLMGYSWGSCINDVAVALGERGIPVDLLIYVDPVNWSARGLSYGDVPANVRHAYRFYTGDLLMHSRRDIAPVDPLSTRCTNLRLATAWFLWPVPLGRHLSAPGRLTSLISELIARGAAGELDSIRFTKRIGADRFGSPVYEVAKSSGWTTETLVAEERGKVAGAGDRP